MTTDVARPARQPQAQPSIPTVANGPWRQLLRFAAVGAVSTAGYALLYLILRPVFGPFAANALALMLTAVANTAANRRLTFGVRGSSRIVGDHAVGLLAFAAGLALTSGALAGLHAITDPARGSELVVLMVANGLSTVLRFGALKLAFDRHTRACGGRPLVR